MIDLVYINRLDWRALNQSGRDKASQYDNEGRSAKCFDREGPTATQRPSLKELVAGECGSRPRDCAARPDSGFAAGSCARSEIDK